MSEQEAPASLYAWLTPIQAGLPPRTVMAGGADRRMILADLYKMMTSGGMDTMGRAVVMIKFQAGLDSGTLADGFNFRGYGHVLPSARLAARGRPYGAGLTVTYSDPVAKLPAGSVHV